MILKDVRKIYFEKQIFYQISKKTENEILYCEHCDLKFTSKCKKYRSINGQCNQKKYPISKDWFVITKMFKKRF